MNISRTVQTVSVLALLVLALLVLALSAAAAGAQTPRGDVPPSPFATGAPRIEKIVEEHLYFFRQIPYQPPVTIEAAEPAGASHDSPETAMLAQMSAILRGDFEKFRSTWEPEARAMMEKHDRDRGWDREFWLAKWRQVYGGKRLELTRRIETGPYVLVAYRILPAEDAGDHGGEVVETANAFKRQADGRWLATQELASDPVLAYWQTPDYKIRIMARGISGH